MTNRIERKVSFEQFDNGNGWPGSYDIVRFAIEPPIDVHDPTFLDQAAWLEQQRDRWPVTFDERDYKVYATYSDEQATYGTVLVGEYGCIRPESPLTKAFTRILNPLGNIALSFEFNKDFSQ